MSEYFVGKEGFVWWQGVVEDRNDPLKLGRCRVRIAAFHTNKQTDLPTNALPWAHPIQPITSAAMGGVGTSPIGPVEGTWVVGFFRDGANAQEPVMFGTLGGFPEMSGDLHQGAAFGDPLGNSNGTEYYIITQRPGSTYGPTGTEAYPRQKFVYKGGTKGDKTKTLTYMFTPSDAVLAQPDKKGDSDTNRLSRNDTGLRPTAGAAGLHYSQLGSIDKMISSATSLGVSLTSLSTSLPQTLQKVSSGEAWSNIAKDVDEAKDAWGAAVAVGGTLKQGLEHVQQIKSDVLQVQRSVIDGINAAKQLADNMVEEGIEYISEITGITEKKKQLLAAYNTAIDALRTVGISILDGGPEVIKDVAKKQGITEQELLQVISLTFNEPQAHPLYALKEEGREINVSIASTASISAALLSNVGSLGSSLISNFGTIGLPSVVTETIDTMSASVKEFASAITDNVTSSISGLLDTNAVTGILPISEMVDAGKHLGFAGPDTIVSPLSVVSMPTAAEAGWSLPSLSDVGDHLTGFIGSFVPTGIGGGGWSEPPNPYAALYPYNHVRESESGHIQEFDDTPGSERIHTYHKAGTFDEIHPDGSHVEKIVGHNYTIVAKDNMVYILGSASVTCDGNMKLKVAGDLDIDVGGNLSIMVGGSKVENVSAIVAEQYGAQMTSVATLQTNTALARTSQIGTADLIVAGTNVAIKSPAIDLN